MKKGFDKEAVQNEKLKQNLKKEKQTQMFMISMYQKKVLSAFAY